MTDGQRGQASTYTKFSGSVGPFRKDKCCQSNQEGGTDNRVGLGGDFGFGHKKKGGRQWLKQNRNYFGIIKLSGCI